MKENYLEEKKQTEKFVANVKQQLSLMTEQEKDNWIINQAIILSSSKQQEFLKTLSGEKIIMNMPDDKEFYQFCSNVSNGTLYIGYETWYEEFNEYGSFYDDWEQQFYDNCHVIEFIDNIFTVCHSLNKLGYYEKTCDYMENLSKLSFEIIETSDSEDSYNGTLPFTLNDAFDNRLPYHNKKNIAFDWIYAYCHKQNNTAVEEKAKELLNIFIDPLCNKVSLSDFDDIDLKLLDTIQQLLFSQIRLDESIFQKKFNGKEFLSDESYYFKKKLDRKKELLEDLKCQN
ncbi:MAG: hypothetical protein LUG12_03915 [Erysipelotrichaceae bacterium]|nr:hypothetical protein [Erysipelotrichaceae bacterium]